MPALDIAAAVPVPQASGPTKGPAADADPAPAMTPAEWRDASLANPAPVYPRAARLAGREGQVVLRVVVSPAGTVESLHVVSSSGVDALDGAATRAVRQWRFHPATQGGKAVSSVLEVPVTFRLR